MHPFDEDALNDNFQDARVLEQADYYTELEVIHYPYSTAENTISANPNWQQDYAGMTDYLNPGITTNWDSGMKQNLLSELQADGIVVGNLTDKQVVQQVSSWVVNKYNAYNPLDVFTTFYIHYPNGQPEIYPGLEDAFDRDKGPYGWTPQEQFEHELLGKGMYYNKTCGTCTSFAVALTTVLRAIGIPTRMILVIPAVDASNPNQSQLVQQGISNNQVRQVILDWLSGAGTGFTSHTFNEVYVGNRWHRLNYAKLGQGNLDPHLFGLTTHLYTFNDLSDANLAPTWGWRYGKGIRNDVFGHSNPYTTIMLSDPDAVTIGPTIYVDDNALGDPGPGDPVISDPCEDGSLLHPYDSIQQAIDVAEYGNTIIVQQGTYTGIGNRDIDFRGLAITVRSTDPNNPNVVAATVIDCQGSESESHRGFYFHGSEGPDSVLDGLTITNGYASGNWPKNYGGGIICYSASPTIKNCIVINNTAEDHGGGIYSYSSSPTLINCTLRANSAGSNGTGGGMHNGPSSPNLIDCIFIKNTSGSFGGGISTSSNSSPTLTNCTFSGNSAWRGGAIGVRNSDALLTNCILWGNTASSGGNEIYNDTTMPSAPVISYCDIAGCLSGGSWDPNLGSDGGGNIDQDPCFVDPGYWDPNGTPSDANDDFWVEGDYHLKSEGGRWDPCSESWVLDDVTSPCIDKGDPNSLVGDEPLPNGGRINMGAYGGTDQASKSLTCWNASACAGQPFGDATCDGNVNFADLFALKIYWAQLAPWIDPECCADFSRDGKVSFADLFALKAGFGTSGYSPSTLNQVCPP